MNDSSLRGRRPERPKATTDQTGPVDFQAFHAMYRGDYVRWASLYLGSRADAEDAVGEAMVELLGKWPTVLTQEEPAAYAWWLVKNRVKDAARSRSRHQKLADAIFTVTALQEAADPIGELENSLAVWQAIDALPDRQHDVVLMRYSLGLTVPETAAVLGITEATVRSTVRDARRRLRAALDLDTKKGHADDRSEVA
ncbi:RNA polymerase sigma factor [Actinacidiphila acidipaludis]|nr:sigma-70 family RNA polymerase sigma factor [Streptomyces acidipaludis]